MEQLTNENERTKSYPPAQTETIANKTRGKIEEIDNHIIKIQWPRWNFNKINQKSKKKKKKQPQMTNKNIITFSSRFCSRTSSFRLMKIRSSCAYRTSSTGDRGFDLKSPFMISGFGFFLINVNFVRWSSSSSSS